jgi:hypothetical protein
MGAQPAWVEAFVNPALEETQRRPPDFEDDFSAPKAEWQLSGPQGDLKIEDFITEGALKVDFQPGKLTSPALTATNFVIEYDFLPPTEASYGFNFGFCGEADRSFYLLGFTGRDWSLGVIHPEQEFRGFAFDNESPEIVPGQWTHVLLIVHENKFAFFLNAKLTGYILDETLHGDKNYFNFEEGTKTLDNVKFWSLPAWAKHTPNRPPDFEDDFSRLKPDWGKNKYIVGFQVTDGVLRLPEHSLVGTYSLQALDYVLQTDLRFSEIGENMEFLYALRLTEYEGGKYGTEYVLSIFPRKKNWEFKGNTDPSPQGQYRLLQSGRIEAFEAGQWIHLTVAVSGDSVWIYWDDELLLNYQGLELTGELNHFGVYTESDTFRLDLDNWKFWKLK